MKNLLQFFARFGNFLLFLVLEVVAFMMAATYNRHLNSVVWSAANRWTAGIENVTSAISDYFHLRVENDQLSKENALLMEKIAILENKVESTQEDSTLYQYTHLDWHYIPAKIIGIRTNQQHNYLTLNKGTRDSVKVNMGVICNDGAVGIISAVGEKYSVVIPIIHTEISLSCRLKKNGYVVGTNWKGIDYQRVGVTDISRHIAIAKGDTVVTSGLTPVFPEGIMVGIMDNTHLQDGDNYYQAEMQLTTDYKQLRYVQIVYNPSLKEAE